MLSEPRLDKGGGGELVAGTRTVLGDDGVYVENDNRDIADRQSVCE